MSDSNVTYQPMRTDAVGNLERSAQIRIISQKTIEVEFEAVQRQTMALAVERSLVRRQAIALLRELTKAYPNEAKEIVRELVAVVVK